MAPRPITFVDGDEFLGYDRSAGRVEKRMASGVTVSGNPHGDGIQWQAHDAGGKPLPGFRLEISRPDDVIAAHPIFIDDPSGCWFCYDDADAGQCICNKVPC